MGFDYKLYRESSVNTMDHSSRSEDLVRGLVVSEEVRQSSRSINSVGIKIHQILVLVVRNTRHSLAARLGYASRLGHRDDVGPGVHQVAIPPNPECSRLEKLITKSNLSSSPLRNISPYKLFFMMVIRGWSLLG